MKNLFTSLCLITSGIAFAQSAQLTPVVDIGTQTVAVNVPAKFENDFPAGKTLTIPTKYKVSVFYAGSLKKPRFMTFSPTGVLHVSDAVAGKVYALPDKNNDGIADTILEAATGFKGNHDAKFYKGSLYVTEATKIWKCTDADGDGVYETKSIFINNLGNNDTTGHVTRTIVFDSINKKVYVSVGSSCNVCREDNRAIIEQYNDDGSDRKVFATGIRNAVGMTLHPVTNRLWANNNGSDQQGNETPPEWIDVVRDGGFYGHPFAYGDGVWFNFNAHPDYQALLPITAVDSQKVQRMLPPAALIRAHSAPMAIEFLPSIAIAKNTALQDGFLTALRGSWNTTAPNNFRGFKVIYGHVANAMDTTVDYVGDFCTGFLTDTVKRVFWGRPVGIAFDKLGKVYISSDEGNSFVLILTPDEVTSIDRQNEVVSSSVIYPNPAKDQFNLSLTMTQSAKVTATLYDIAGKAVLSLMDQTLASGSHTQQLGVTGLAPGYYLLKITAGNNTYNHKLILKD
ncbi:MAG TPA: T9SS type A sorting domain-containing protein [Bacteroidia bacterium]|jgi:glucose/arabinose dehydrogenase|nr:T9SS type A sorting domain-containing protein [Bacteroidia bacterium]